MSTTETITVLWAGQRRRATVIKRFKNGKVKVQVTRARNFGRPGSVPTGAEVVTVEPWQIITGEDIER